MGQRLSDQKLQQGISFLPECQYTSEASTMQEYVTWHWWAEQQHKCIQAEPRSWTHIKRRATGLFDQKLAREGPGSL